MCNSFSLPMAFHSKGFRVRGSGFSSKARGWIMCMEEFIIEKVRARGRWHLTARTVRKLLAHTVACFLCHENGYPMLHFDNLLG